jgi:hypothetical protein
MLVSIRRLTPLGSPLPTDALRKPLFLGVEPSA